MLLLKLFPLICNWSPCFRAVNSGKGWTSPWLCLCLLLIYPQKNPDGSCSLDNTGKVLSVRMLWIHSSYYSKDLMDYGDKRLGREWVEDICIHMFPQVTQSSYSGEKCTYRISSCYWWIRRGTCSTNFIGIRLQFWHRNFGRGNIRSALTTGKQCSHECCSTHFSACLLELNSNFSLCFPAIICSCWSWKLSYPKVLSWAELHVRWSIKSPFWWMEGTAQKSSLDTMRVAQDGFKDLKVFWS